MSRIQAVSVLSAMVGVAVGLWTSALGNLPLCPAPGQPLYERCPADISVTGALPPSTFTTWECALFGLAAAAVMLLLAWVARSAFRLLTDHLPGVAPAGIEPAHKV
jgi:hypothetical protein